MDIQVKQKGKKTHTKNTKCVYVHFKKVEMHNKTVRI